MKLVDSLLVVLGVFLIPASVVILLISISECSPFSFDDYLLPIIGVGAGIYSLWLPYKSYKQQRKSVA